MDTVLEPLAAWLATYALHSTLLLGGVWLVLRLRHVPGHLARQSMWRTALVGSLVTATLQVVAGVPTFGGEWALPAASFGPAVTPAAAPPIEPLPEPDREPDRELDRELRCEPHLEPGLRLAQPFEIVEADDRDAASFSPRDARSEASGGMAHLSSAEAGPPLATRPAARGVPWVRVAVGAWLVLALLAVVRLAARRLALARRLADRRPVSARPLLAELRQLCRGAGLQRPVRLSSSDRLAVPAALGSDEICLPRRALDELAPAELRAVLAHELAHLLRRDPVWLVALHALEGALFFQPLNRVARRQLEESAEFLCDEWAARQTGAPDSLARCLGVVAGWLAGGRAPALAGMADADASMLVRRVGRLLDGGPSDGRPPWWRSPALLVVVGLVACGGPKIAADKRDGGPADDHPSTQEEALVAVESGARVDRHDEVHDEVHGGVHGTTHGLHERERHEEARREALALRHAELAARVARAGPDVDEQMHLAELHRELERLHRRRDELARDADQAMREATHLRETVELRAAEALWVAESALARSGLGSGSSRAPLASRSPRPPRPDTARLEAARAAFDRWLVGEIERRLRTALETGADDAVGDAQARKLRAVAGVMARSADWSSESLSLQDGTGTLERRLRGFDDRREFDWLLTDVDPVWSEAQQESLLEAVEALDVELSEGHVVEVDVSDVEAALPAPRPPAQAASPRPLPSPEVPLLPGAPATAPDPAPAPSPATGSLPQPAVPAPPPTSDAPPPPPPAPTPDDEI